MSDTFTEAEVEAWKAKIKSDSKGSTWESRLAALNTRLSDLETKLKNLPTPRKVAFKPSLVAGSLTGIGFGMTGLSITVNVLDWSATGISFAVDGVFGSAQKIGDSAVNLVEGKADGWWKRIFSFGQVTTLAQQRAGVSDSTMAALSDAMDVLNMNA